MYQLIAKGRYSLRRLAAISFSHSQVPIHSCSRQSQVTRPPMRQVTAILSRTGAKETERCKASDCCRENPHASSRRQQSRSHKSPKEATRCSSAARGTGNPANFAGAIGHAASI